jgi:NADH-ubiquinone oxidoreductase chain 5
MFTAILSFPLLGFLFSGFLSQFLGSLGACRFSILCIFFSFLVSLVIFMDVVFLGNSTTLSTISWIQSGLFYSNWGFLFDGLTVVILIVVTSISILVHIYSSSYIASDPHICRFISYLSFFTFFIIILVSADNFIQIFVGWEGVGLCSYLLINFWYTRIQANKAAIKAILVNRIGDFGLALGILGIFFETGSVEYSIVFSVVPFFFFNTFSFFGFTFHSITLFSFILFIGAIGKSAQLGLHTWLPDAIEGPTPVSALIHAATIVTAGVFLLVRCSPIFEFCPTILWFITLFGGMTAFFAATTGLFQNDLKKVIAYSTCSQLGYMIFSCGLSAYNVGLFHLANHAFFKALLFLTAGGIIHAVNDEQDIRKIGGLVQILPFCYSIMLVGSIALIGFPFLSGFYSKEVILEIAYAKSDTVSQFAYIFGVLAAFFTALYSTRSIYLTFFSIPRGFKKNFENSHEVPSAIGLPLAVLFIGSVFFGYTLRDLFIGLGSSFFGNAIFTHPVHFIVVEAEFLPLFIKLIPLIFSFFGIFMGILIYFLLNYSFFFFENFFCW